MGSERLIICGGVRPSVTEATAEHALRLDLWGRSGPANITLRIEDIHQRLGREVPEAFQDLIEIAGYVFSADQATWRGGLDVETFGGKWRRPLVFHIPVRRLELWDAAEMKEALRETLGFLSDDHYEFTFYPTTDAPPFQLYLPEVAHGEVVRGAVQQVMLYSGGIDSLGGVVDEVIVQKRRLVLVNHRPTQKHSNRFRELERLLEEKAGPLRPAHVAVRIFKDKEMGREPSQRSRSFLFVALGATVAKMVGLNSVRFYENGVVSLNLPVCEQVVGARATRTTHPRVLQGFQKLLSLVSSAPFIVENPFLWRTKAEIIDGIVKAGCGPLITPSISCSHTWEATLDHPHCGTCSQCLDRRFSIVAAGAEQFDPPEHYKVDIFSQALPEDADRIMGAAYLERANVFRNIPDGVQLIVRYPQVAEVLRFLDLDRPSAAARILDLHKRHGEEVRRAAQEMLRRRGEEIFTRRLPGDCLLRAVIESHGLPPMSAPKAAYLEEAPLAKDGENASSCLFQKAGSSWKVRFDGSPEFLVPDTLGARYADYLLHHPDAPISAYDLEITVTPEKATRPRGSRQDDLDANAKRQYLREVERLRMERDTAKAQGNETEINRLDAEIDAIEAELGRSLHASDAGERARGNVSKGIAGLLRRLNKGSKHEKAFAAHLKQCLSLGYNFRYIHPKGQRWA